MTNEQILTQFDSWLDNESPHAALTFRAWLTPVEGRDAVIFPPTYAPPRNRPKEDWPGYNIDGTEGTSVCQIDSVGSQANRMEPMFKRAEYAQLVPQITISAGQRSPINLLDAGHRAADAIVRFGSLDGAFWAAFNALKLQGNAEPLARLAPTSLIFGVWDSRATQVKVPRIVRSVIRAYHVKPLHRSAQYSTIAGEILGGGEAPVKTEGKESELGLAHVPAAYTHGGVQVFGEIRREAAVNLVALRHLRADGEDDDATRKLRRYILGLALVAFTAPQEIALREGCELVPDPEKPAIWTTVKNDGMREPFAITHDEALPYAKAAAASFRVAQAQAGEFSVEIANQLLQLPEKDRKAVLRAGPVTPDAIAKAKKKKPSKKVQEETTADNPPPAES